MLRYVFGLALFVAVLQPISTQVLWYYVSRKYRYHLKGSCGIPIVPLLAYLSTRAVSVMRGNGTGVALGNIQFSQNTLYGPVIMQGAISGLVPGTFRLVIHRFGDLTNGCLSIGAVFNPEQAPNGWGLGLTRAVGDLGALQVGQVYFRLYG